MSSRPSVIRKRWKERIRAGETILCAICGERIPTRSRAGNRGSVSVDHIIPKSLGGSSRIENLQPTHSKCNNDKGNKHDRPSP